MVCLVNQNHHISGKLDWNPMQRRLLSFLSVLVYRHKKIDLLRMTMFRPRDPAMEPGASQSGRTKRDECNHHTSETAGETGEDSRSLFAGEPALFSGGMRWRKFVGSASAARRRGFRNRRPTARGNLQRGLSVLLGASRPGDGTNQGSRFRVGWK